MTNKLKKLAGVAFSAMIMTSALVMGSGTDKAAEAHPHNMMYMKRMMCNKVMVSGRYAWLKAMPMLNSKTLRVAHWGEPLWVVRNSMGHAHHKNGWWLVKRSNGYRYWVHQSVVRCSK